MRDGRISGELSREQASETAALALALPDGITAAPAATTH
jgi:L-arabinose transport system ATP-binding protein